MNEDERMIRRQKRVGLPDYRFSEHSPETLRSVKVQ